MKKEMKNLMTITTIIVFSIIAVASADDKSKKNNEEATAGNNELATEGNNGGGSDKTYDYKEDYHNGWTIFHGYKPEANISECESRKCNWCGNYYGADRVNFDEIPDISNMMQMIYITENGNIHLSSLEAALSSGFSGIGDLSIDDELVDTGNKYIYTKWETKCEFDNGNYCSRKCASQNSAGC